MKSKMMVILFAMLVLLGSGCGGVDKFDTMTEKDEICAEKWANYESNIQRRHDMIPQLVSIVKGSAAHENKTLTEVMEARAAATQIKLTADDLSDPEKVKAFEEAQSKIKGSLSRLMMVQETYPDLKANKQFSDLQTQIEGTENRILRAREEYNKSVKDYNFELKRLGGRVLNKITNENFKPREYFHAVEAASAAPVIDFSK